MVVRPYVGMTKNKMAATMQVSKRSNANILPGGEFYASEDSLALPTRLKTLWHCPNSTVALRCTKTLLK